MVKFTRAQFLTLPKQLFTKFGKLKDTTYMIYYKLFLGFVLR